MKWNKKFPDLNRAKALAAYHLNRDDINARRRVSPRRSLFTAVRRISKRLKAVKAQRRYLLERAARKPHRRTEAKLRKRLCSRWERSMKARTSSGFILSLSGISVSALRVHLSNQFKSGMTWDNHGYGPGKWNIDHITPLAVFDLPSQAKQAFNYKNLQPLWHEENMLKRDRILPRTVS
jgi:hypothetical protein